MMTMRQMDKAIREIQNYFVGYKIKQVSGHLSSIEIESEKLASYSKFLGVRYNKRYEKVVKTLKFEDYFETGHLYYGATLYVISCAIDEENEIVYWNYNSTK